MLDRAAANAARDAIRARLADPRDVARRLGLLDGAQSQARGLTVRCPAHGGVSLSLTQGADRTLRARCFGCDFTGDVFSLLAASRGLTLPRDFRAVIEEAASLASMPLPDLAPMREAPAPVRDELFAAIVERLLRLCPIKWTHAVRIYLERRGIAEEAARDGWGALPPRTRRADMQASILERLVSAFGGKAMVGSGLVCEEESGALRFVQPGARVLIPWRDQWGRIVSLQRRRIDVREPRYVATRGRPLAQPYGLDEMLNANPGAPVAWVEGAADVLSLRCLSHGPVVVLGLPGVEGWRAGWAAYGKGRENFVALDADEAGDRKADVMTADLLAAGATRVRRARPARKDWGAVLEERIALAPRDRGRRGDRRGGGAD